MKKLLLLMVSVITLTLNAQVYTEYFEYKDVPVVGQTPVAYEAGDELETGDALVSGYYGWYLNPKASNRKVGANDEGSPIIGAGDALYYKDYVAALEGQYVELDSAVAYSKDQRSSNWVVNDGEGDTLKLPYGGGAIYASFMYTPKLQSYESIRDFFGFEWSATTNSSRGRVFINPDGNDVQFGVSRNKTKEADGLDLGDVFVDGMGDTYLFVLKYVMGDPDVDKDDYAMLYVNPNPLLPEAAQDTVTGAQVLTSTDAQSDKSAGTIVRLNIRQRGQNGDLGGIRVAKSWEALLFAPTAVTDMELTNTGNIDIDVRYTDFNVPVFTPADATEQRVSWSSSDESVVTVNSDGLITAIDSGAVATITATSRDGGFVSTCTVTPIWNFVTGVTVSEDVIDVPVSHESLDPADRYTVTISKTIAPSNASNIGYSWRSDNEAVAIVDSLTGVVSALSEGTANIIVTTTEGGFVDTCVVTGVAYPVSGFEFDADNDTIDYISVNRTKTLAPTFTPSYAYNQGVNWVSRDASIATVDADGNVTAVYSDSSVYIYGQTIDGGFEDSCFVITKWVALDTVTLDKEQLELVINVGSGQLTPIFDPADASNQVVSWSSSDESVAKVLDGEVTAVGFGQATITVTTNEGPYEATAKVVTRATAINETAISALSIYPNPSNGSFTVANVAGADVVIYDITGKVVDSAKGISGAQSFQGLSQGLYFVAVTTATSKEVTKVIVK